MKTKSKLATTFIITAFFQTLSFVSQAQDFITQWNLATTGSGINQLSFGTATSGSVNYTWQEISPSNASGSGSWSGSTLTITGLPTGATIRLQIAPTNFQRIIINSGLDRNRLTLVEQWGTTAWTSMQRAFYDCQNLQITATDVPNLSSVTNMSEMFSGCISLNSPSNIGSWNTAAVTDMNFMFYGATAFNQDISGWNTGAVTNMSTMFSEAAAFNQPIGSWNTGAVTDMSGMFQFSSAFNQNISAWNTAAVTDMSSMFAQATAFNQNIEAWNTEAVTDMRSMFRLAVAFNQNIGAWVLHPTVDIRNIFDDSGVDCNNYSSTLIGWSANPSTPNGRSLGAIGRQYGTNAVSARTNLISTKGWTITGDASSGAVCAPASVSTITNFSPIAGPIGATITITGTNFSATPANNIVYFGTAQATVTTATTTSLTVTVPVGATYEPITVTVDGLTSYSTLRFIVTHPNGNINFNNKICFSVGSNPRETAIADLNNDGHLDLIVTRTDVSTGIILFGNGNGTFQQPISITTGTGGALTVGDYSGDGMLDLAFANYSSSNNATTSVLINNGTGSFPTTETYFLSNSPVGVGSGAVYIADADFDLDGKVDLVSAIDNIPGSLSIIPNNGVSFDSKVEYPTNDNYPYSVTTADLNNDKYPDWAVANFFSQTVIVFINDGSGGVLNQTTYATGSGTHEVELGDLNKDNHLDLIAVNATANTVSVLLNDGTGNFSPKTDYTSGSTYQPDVDLADIDGDGNIDAITGGSGTQIFVLKGDGVGGFGTPQAFDVESTPFGVAVGDLDEDGEPDIVSSNFGDGTICLLLSKPTGTVVIAAVPLTTQVGSIVSIDLIPLITTSNTLDINSLTVTILPASGATVNIDGAGILTLDYTGLNFAGNETFTIEACDQLGNCTTQTFEVTVIGELTIYNALSPNGDGLNDNFIIEYIDSFTETRTNSVKIYNRWGDLVFDISDYNNSTNVFKGLSNKGKELPTGIYFYKIDFESGRKSKTGYISLKR